MEPLKQAARVLAVGFGVRLRARAQWRFSLFLEMGSTAVWMVVYLLFWDLIFVRSGGFGGWTFPSVMVFVAFQELFFGISRGLFLGALTYWWIIHTGRLDVHLARPMDPRLTAICLSVDPPQLIRSCLMFSLVLGIAVSMGFPLSLFRLLIAVLLAFLSAVGKALLALSINYIAFWWGNVDALHELIGTFDHFLSVPMTVLPNALQIFFTIGIPLFFAVTFPALFAGDRLSLASMGRPLLLLVACLGGWAFVQELLWRRGLRRYESYRG
ncbi:MAG: ABC-2 family transporter protein [Bacillota bacterium]